MAGLKKQQAKKQEWLSNGHGQYEEIPEEKEFFNVTKRVKMLFVISTNLTHSIARSWTSTWQLWHLNMWRPSFARLMLPNAPF